MQIYGIGVILNGKGLLSCFLLLLQINFALVFVVSIAL